MGDDPVSGLVYDEVRADRDRMIQDRDKYKAEARLLARERDEAVAERDALRAEIEELKHSRFRADRMVNDYGAQMDRLTEALERIATQVSLLEMANP